MSGLKTTQGTDIPLKGVRVDATIIGVCAEVTVTHSYHNTASNDVEAVYVFPLEDGAAVNQFRALVDGKEIVGEVKEKDEAFDTYDDAMMDGHGAFLVDQERPDIFTASVGNLKAGSKVDVQVSYVSMLEFEGPALRFMLPTTVSPRYVPATTGEVGQPDGERINPERWPTVPYGLTLNITVKGAGIECIESPTHPIKSRLGADKATITLSRESAAMDKDFVLLIEQREIRKPSVTVAREEDGTRVAMVTFYPDENEFKDEGPKEVAFVLDCSGSMGGESIEQAKRALALCVRALSEGDFFNIYRFGSSFTTLWDKCKPYTQASLEEANQYIEETWADMGGTEIFQPMSHFLAQEPVGEKTTRQLLLLTDGQVSNESAVIDLCAASRDTTRVFSFGIGAGASQHLVKGVARASGGAAEFIAPGERIEPKVIRMFNRVCTPAMPDLHVDWGDLKVQQSPRKTPPLFAGESVTVFGRITGGDAHKVALKAGERAWPIDLDLEHADTNTSIPTLWARHTIRDLESDARGGSKQNRGRRTERKKERLIELGIRYQLITSATSFVAVEQRSEANRSEDAQLVNVPIAQTKGWGQQDAQVMQRKQQLKKARRTRASSLRSIPMPPSAPSPMAPPAPMPMAPPPSAPAPGGPPMVSASASYGGGGRGGAPKKAKAPSLFERMSAKFEQVMGSSGAPEAKASAPVSTGMARYEMEDSIGGGAAFAEEESESVILADEGGFGATPDLFDLLLTQRADGAFPMSAELKAYQPQTDALDKALANDNNLVVSTALVVWILENQESAREAEWRQAAKKARAYLKQHGGFDISSLLNS